MAVGITELLMRATTVASYAKTTGLGTGGVTARLTLLPDAQPADLNLGTVTRSGL